MYRALLYIIDIGKIMCIVSEVIMKNVGNMKVFTPIWAAILILGLFMVFFRIGAGALWYDESYSAAAVEHPVGQMVSMIGKDSHPPMYFMLLKLLTTLGGRSVVSLRFLSAISVIMLAALGFFRLRPVLGELGAIAFSLFVLFTPISIVAAQDARMYSLSAFLVTAMIIEGYLAFVENRRIDWIMTAVFSLASAYTHYFGLIAAVVYWAVFLAALFIEKGRGRLRTGLLTGGALILLYLPWFVFLYGQASRVAKNFWIPPVTFYSVLHVLTHFFQQKFSWGLTVASSITFAVIFSAAVAGIVILIRRKDKLAFLAVSSFAVFTLTLGAALVLSKLIRPILVDRYMISCLGALILGLSCFLAGIKSKRILAFALAAYILTGSMIIIKIYATPMNGPMNEVYQDLRTKVKKGDIFIHGSEHNLGTFAYYFPDNRHYLYIPENFVPFSNYQVFSTRAEWGSDYRQFSDKPVTLWLTNRMGEFYSLPSGKIIAGAHRRMNGSPKQYSKEPGWYKISVIEAAYDETKTAAAADENGGSGKLTIKVNGLKTGLGGKILYALYESDPISKENFLKAGEAEATAERVTVAIDDLPFGDYVFLAFHDLNGNMQPDFSDGAPLEMITFGLDPESLPQNPGFDDLKHVFSAEKSAWNFQAYYRE